MLASVPISHSSGKSRLGQQWEASPALDDVEVKTLLENGAYLLSLRFVVRWLSPMFPEAKIIKRARFDRLYVLSKVRTSV